MHAAKSLLGCLTTFRRVSDITDIFTGTEEAVECKTVLQMSKDTVRQTVPRIWTSHHENTRRIIAKKNLSATHRCV